MSALIVQRKKEFAYQLIPFNIYLNNKKIGKLDSGETKRFNIHPGKYTIVIKGGIFLKSRAVNFVLNREIPLVFEVGNFGNGYFRRFLSLRKIFPQSQIEH